MLQAMFSGVSGIQAHQTKMNVIGNNISNVNTVGYKAGRVSFQDQLSQTLRAASGPGKGSGGENPAQVGLGVTLGAVDTIETQGNLQSTGKMTDMAIQGGGFFAVSDGKTIQYTRDGGFDLDSSGTLVNPATGQKLLGYQADSYGNVDTSAPITGASALRVPIGMLTDAKQTQNMSFLGNLDAASAVNSTQASFTGNLDPASAATAQVQSSITVYDNLGNSHTLQATFLNPTATDAAHTAAGATRQWDVVIKSDGGIVYDSTDATNFPNASKLYWDSANNRWSFMNSTPAFLATNPSTLSLDGGTVANSGKVISGLNGAANLPLTINLGSLTNTAAASSVTGSADGQAGSTPVWGASQQVYDSLGVGHLITFKYTRVPVQPGTLDPTAARARWNWTASENGTQIGSSSDAGNTPLYFGDNGRLIGGSSQKITVPTTNGSVSPVSILVDNSKITQLASDANVAGGVQDGYPVGTLQSFNVSPDGTITGIYSSGQSRSLGQVALGYFANPAGLEKVGNNMFRESDNSGEPQIGIPNQSGRGKINPGYLEMSNVDLSTEFTNLIVTQRGFQANTRIVSVVDQLLQDVIDLKR